MTRYLSAAVTFDSGLAQAVIDDILEQPHRAIASTPGVDMATVLRYALAAKRRRVIRDALLLVYLFLMFATIFFFYFTVPFFLFIGWMTILLERYNRFFGESSKPLRSGEFGRAARNQLRGQAVVSGRRGVQGCPARASRMACMGGTALSLMVIR